jgi:hypothetical protein
MNTHTCPKCKVIKPISEFNKDKSKKSGLCSKCKDCQKQYVLNNKEKISEKRVNWLFKNKQHILNYSKNYRIQNKEKILKDEKIYAEKNKEKIKKRRKAYESKNKKLISLKRKESRKKYKEKSRITQNKYAIKKRKESPVFSMECRIGGLIRKSLQRNGYAKKSRTFEILGCDYISFANHIESQFKDGMSWENRNEWHIDHIIPLASAKNEIDVITLNHYLNLRPLWAKENILKGAKLPAPIQKNKIELSIAKEKGLKLTQQSIF